MPEQISTERLKELLEIEQKFNSIKKIIGAEELNNIANSEIWRLVLNIVCDKLQVSEKEAIYEASLFNDLGADSLDLVEITMDLEREFKIHIPDDRLDEARTVGDIYEMIRKEVMAKG